MDQPGDWEGVQQVSEETQEQTKNQSKPWLFKKGQSGNPGGKPKGLKSYKTIIEQIGLMPAPKEMVDKLREVFPQLEKKPINMKEAASLKAYVDALKGDDKARDFIANREEGNAKQTIEHKGDMVRNISVRDQQTAENLQKLREQG